MNQFCIFWYPHLKEKQSNTLNVYSHIPFCNTHHVGAVIYNLITPAFRLQSQSVKALISRLDITVASTDCGSLAVNQGYSIGGLQFTSGPKQNLIWTVWSIPLPHYPPPGWWTTPSSPSPNPQRCRICGNTGLLELTQQAANHWEPFGWSASCFTCVLD